MDTLIKLPGLIVPPLTPVTTTFLEFMFVYLNRVIPRLVFRNSPWFF